MSQFNRIESPPPFDDYRQYLPFLRRDFRKMCAYCERPEPALGGEEAFEIDHFRPKGRGFPELEAEYSNLYYACAKCNRHKAGAWPSALLREQDFRFSDPCQEDMYIQHFQEADSCELRPLTNCGTYTCSHIRLNRSDLLRWRLLRRDVAERIQNWERAAGRLEAICLLENEPNLRGDIEAEIAEIRSAIVRDREMFSL